MPALEKVAVLLAAYNGMKWIDDQINSILNQEGVLVTIFISVDTSTDGTEHHISKLAEANTNIRLLPIGNRFGGAAKNFFYLIKFVDFSNFDYISLADQDDIWNKDKLKRAIYSIKQKNVDAYSSNVMAFWQSGALKLINKAQKQKDFDFLFEAAGPGCTYILKQNFAQRLKECISHNWEVIQGVNLHDWFTYAYARANGFTWFIDSVPSMLYRQHANNQVGINSGWKAFRYRLLKLSDGWGLEQSLLIAKIIGFERSSFVSDWLHLTPISIFKLSIKAYQCRRRPRDVVAFMLVCWIVAIRKMMK